MQKIVVYTHINDDNNKQQLKKGSPSVRRPDGRKSYNCYGKKMIATFLPKKTIRTASKIIPN